MPQLITVKISGIKCDNPDCDYRDDEVSRDNYLEYIGKPCPECGENLLTQEDFDSVVTLEGLVGEFDLSLPENLLGEEELYDVNMDGSGAMNFTKREAE